MKEELGFVGNEYNEINTCFTVGYVIGQIPSNLSLHYFKPRFFFRKSHVIDFFFFFWLTPEQYTSSGPMLTSRLTPASMMCIWAGLTMVTASVHSPQAIMAIRFFQGLAEASTFVGTHYILGAWYTERELGKRSGIFTASGLAGTL